MSVFLRALVRSEGKSCEGKLKYPREDSAVRNALAMTEKKKKLHAAEGRESTEFFESYKCNFCDGWHVGHQTNFDWIPVSHKFHWIMINHYRCATCEFDWFTSTIFSTRVLSHFPSVQTEQEQCVLCPKCKNSGQQAQIMWQGRKWLDLSLIDPESVTPLRELWSLDVSVDKPMNL